MQAYRCSLIVGALFLSFVARLTAAPTINTQPVAANIVIGTSTSFNVAATTSGGTLTYQWQGSQDNGATWGNIGNGPPFANVTTATLSLNAPATQYSGAKVRCAVTDSNGTTTTDGTASLTITTTAPLLILAQPVNKSAFQGDSLTTDFKVLATSGGTINYQWQISTWTGTGTVYTAFSNLSNSAPYAGVTTGTLSITDPYSAFGAMPSNPNHYRCVVTNGGSYSVTTRFASLSIYTTPTYTPSVTTKVNGSPASTIVSNDPHAITVQVSGIFVGGAVRIDRYADLNGNGQIDFGEPLVQGFQVVDGNGAGANNTFGGVTDPNITCDDSSTPDGTINASFTLANAADLAKGAGAYIFRVSSPGGLFRTVDSPVFTVTQPTLAHVVSGTVNVPYAQVALLVNSNNGPGVVNETVADGSGNFTLQAAPGIYNVLAVSLGYVTNFNTSPTADTTSADVTGLTINLVPANYINSVTLQDQVSGVPLRGVQVFFQSNSSNNIAIGNTDANGVATGGAVAESDWTIDISSQSLGALGYLRPQSNNGISLNTLAYVQPLRAANAMISGTLTDNTSAPLANVGIQANDQNNQYEADTTTDATGHYYLPVYGSGGGWNVQPDNSDPIFSPSHNPVYLAPSGQGFFTLNGSSANVANFVANVATATLSGTVTNADSGNSALVGVQIDLFSVVGQNNNFVGSVMTGAGGSFSFGVNAGNWSIALDNQSTNSPNNYVSPNLTYAVTDGVNVPNIAFGVKVGTGTIQGTVVDFNNAGVSNGNVSAYATINGVLYNAGSQTDGSGHYSFPVIAGSWTVSANSNSGLSYPQQTITTPGTNTANFSPTVFNGTPGNRTVNAGGGTNFSVGTNVPGSPAYQWQVSTDGGATWSNVTNSATYSGATTNNLNISNAPLSLNANQYHLHVSFTYNSQLVTQDSAAGTLTVNATSPFYNTNPSNQTTTAGSGTAFSVSVSGAPTPTIQWQVSTDGGATWAPLSDGGYYSGTATNTLVVTNADFSINNYRYRTVATNTAGSLNSFAATLTVNRNPQTVNFSGGTVSINTPITLTPSATSGLTSFTYFSTGSTTSFTGPGSGILTITGVGSVTIQANQAGNNFYAPASNTATFTVNSQPVTVSFNNLNQTYDGSPKAVSVTTNPPGVSNSVTYNGGSTPPISAGTYGVAVTINDPNYFLSGPGTNTLTISPANQSISFNPPANLSYTTAPFPLNANATSNLPVTFSYISGPASVSGNQLTLTGTGTVTVRASQSGNGNYNAAPNADRTINVSKGAATVALGNLSAAYDGNPHSVTANTNPNGLAVDITYSGSATAPTSAGTYAVAATINDSLYQGSASNFLVISPAPGPGVEALDPSFTRPQFRRTSLPGRITADQVSGAGKIYATFSNGTTITGANNQRIGAIMRLNSNGMIDGSFTPGAFLADAWAVVPLGNGQVLVGGLARDENSESGFPLFRVFRLNGDGSRDASYNSPVFSSIPRYMTLQSDGRLLVAPSSNNSGNGGLTNLVRLNPDGSQDGTFTVPVFDGGTTTNDIFATILVDPNGKILIGGTFNAVNGTAYPGVARLNANGSLDGSFAPSGFTRNSGNQIRGLGLQTQGANAGKVLVAGGTITVGGIQRPVIRLNTDGSLDGSFTLVTPAAADGSTGVRPRLLNVLPDDRFTIVSGTVTRFTNNGAIDGTFAQPNFSAEAFWIDTLNDGSVLVTPEFGTAVNGPTVNAPFRLTPGGSVDGSFTPPAPFQTEVFPNNFAIQPDGRVLVWGNFDTVNTSARSGMARINTDGSLDAFNLSGVANLYSVQGAGVLADGHILASTLQGTYQNNLNATIARFNADGTVDSGFAIDPQAVGSSFAALPDGHILASNLSAGSLLNGGGGLFLKRLTSSGAIDNTFVGLGSTAFGAVYRDGSNFVTQIVQGQFDIFGHYDDGRAVAIATVPNGSYPANAASLNFTVLRLNVDGTLDTGFTAPAIAWGTSSGFTPPMVDPQNVTQGPQQFFLITASGSPFSGVVPQPDGSVIVYGSFTSLGGHSAPGIARLTNTGAFDVGFSVGTGPQLVGQPSRAPQVESINLAPDGKYWVTGVFDTFGGVAAPGIVRLNADGTVDSTLATALSYRPYIGNGTKVDFGPSGEVYLAGTFGQAFESFPSGLTRLVGTVAPGITTQPQSQTVLAGANVTFSVGVTPGLTVAYQWYLNTVAIPGATNSTLTLTNVQNANAGSYTVAVTNAVTFATSNAAVLSLGTPFNAWQQSKFTAGELTDINISGPNAVYGQDGLPNLVKYALGLEPKQNISTGLPVVSTTGTDWVYTYTRPANITDVTYSVEISTDLVTWTAAGVTHEFVSTSGGIDTWHGRYPLASATKIFFRLNVTQP